MDLPAESSEPARLLDQRLAAIGTLSWEEASRLPPCTQDTVRVAGNECTLATFRQAGVLREPDAVVVTVQLSRPRCFGALGDPLEKGLVFRPGQPPRPATAAELHEPEGGMNGQSHGNLDAPVTLRLLAAHDLPMLHDWLNRPHIVQWWGGERPTWAQVREQYDPAALAQERVTAYVGLLGDVPFAYAQSYVALGAGGGWWPDETDPGVRGIDQSIADAQLLGKGLGTRLVRALVQRLWGEAAVTRIQTDPAPDNLRAIRCYEKAGFRRVKVVTTPDGPALYMLQDRPPMAAGGRGA